jgi:uncharacterized membrane protein YhiD involved in acid resistance
LVYFLKHIAKYGKICGKWSDYPNASLPTIIQYQFYIYMQDFFSTYSRIENPTWEMVIFSFILSFLLSALIAFTYHKTTQSAIKHYGLLQTFIAGAVIATMVLQAIGDNIASGLGMLGALNTVQFRTTLKNPRDSIFMFAALGIGITCGLYGFIIACIGTLFFCLLSFMILHSPFHFSNLMSWRVKVKTEEIIRLSDDFKSVMNEYCTHWTLESINQEKEKMKDTNTNLLVYEYTLQFKDEAKQKDFLLALNYLGTQIVGLSKKNNK